MGGVQCCEPEMRKVDLCPRSLHFLRKPTGGGKVLSLILAGTLAFGMTPAAALTQAAMDVTPAYAGTDPGPATENVLVIDDWDGTTGNNKVYADMAKVSGTGIAISAVGDPAATTYTTREQTFEPGGFNVQVTVTPPEEAEDPTPQVFKLAPSLYDITCEDETNVTRDDESGNLKITNASDLDGYDIKITLKGEGVPKKAGTEDPLDSTAGRIVINKAEAKIVKAPTKAVLGVTTYNDLVGEFALSTAAGSLTSANLDVTMTPAGGAEVEDKTQKITDPANITVEAVLNASTAKNYELDSAGGEWTGTVTVGAADEGTYAVDYIDTGSALADAGLTVDAKLVNAGLEGGTAAAEAKYGDTKLTTDNLKKAVGLYYKGTASGATFGTSPLDASTYDVTWYNGSTKLVTAQGAKAAPVNPGVYTGKVNLNGSDEVLGQAELTVCADLSTQVKRKSADANNTSKPITVKVNGCWPDDVKLQFKEGVTKQDLVDQVANGMTVTLADGTAITGAEKIKELFKFDVTKFVASEGATGGVIEMGYAGDKGEYVSVAPLNYEFGVTLPEAPQLDPVVYNPNGYDIDELLPSFKDVDGTEFEAGTDYDVSVYVADQDGKLQPSDTVDEVGTYRVTVTPMGEKVGPVQERTLTITQLPVTDKNASYLWNGKTTTNGTFSVPFTGGAVAPEPTVTVDVATDTDNSEIAGETGTATLNIVPKKDYDAAEDKAGIDGYVTYANNTAVTNNGAAATITYVGNYKGEKTQNFSIAAADLGSLNPSVTAASQLKDQFNLDNDLSAADVVDPVVKFQSDTDGEGEPIYTELEQGKDYRITRVYLASPQPANLPTGVTAYKFDIEGVGNYKGTVTTGTFKVTTQDLGQAAVASLEKDQKFFYDTDEQEAKVQVNLKGATADTLGIKLDKGVDFDVTYKNNVNAGTATAVITGTGNYAGTLEVPFEIQPLKLDGAKTDKVVLGGADGLVYTGEALTPEVLYNKSTLLPANEGYGTTPIELDQYVDDLSFTYENNTNASTAEAPAYVVISGKNGNFTGTAKAPFAIAQADIAKATVEAAPVAPGGDLADAVKVTLGEAALAAGTDYTVAAEGALPGKVTATVTGTGNYTGTATADVDVLYDVAGLSYQVSSGTYNGQSQTPVVTASYKDAAGKTVEVPASALNVAAGSYVNAGTYKIKVTGNNAAGWGGETTVGYTIAPATVTAKPQVSYAGGLPVVTVPGLTSNDFDWKADAATQTITVTYKGNYKGTAKVAYTPTVAPSDPGSAQPAAGKTGWVGSGNDWAYYENGQQVKGGWKSIGGEWYHFEKSGKMTNTKWFQDADGEWYMLNQSHKGEYGAMLTGWQKDGGEWYHFAKSGAMQSGWMKDTDGTWYLLNSKHDGTFGAMLTGWQKVGGKWYYMDASGAMAENEWVGRYWVDGSGVWTATR
ncbi:hypothetical protein GMI70_03295 [Eggerthellaceae bacterium zg-893]|nr:hypothetical protein [Eggerthellaceae bacterium zg-893]